MSYTAVVCRPGGLLVNHFQFAVAVCETDTAMLLALLVRRLCAAQVFPQQDTRCSLLQLGPVAQSVDAACGHSTAACPLDCAIQFMPMYHRCHNVLNNVYDKRGTDTTDDSNSSTLTEFAALCQNQDTQVLTNRIMKINAKPTCAINISSVLGTIHDV